MSRNEKLYLEDIIVYSDKILSKMRDTTEDAFLANEDRYLAVLHLLQCIGEAASKVSPAVKERFPDIDWYGMVRFRNIVVHQYFGVYNEIVWQIVTEDIPVLYEQMKVIVATLDEK